MNRINELIKEYCPDGVPFKKVKNVYTRVKGTPITAGKMKEIACDNGEIRIFAGGKTIIDAHEKDIPDVKIFDYKMTLIMSGLIICNLVFIFMPFVPSHFIRSLYQQSANNLFIQIMFNIFISLLFINDIILIIVLFFKNKKNGKIIYAKNMIKNSYKIIKKVDKKCELFYAYLLKSLGDNKLLNKNIRKYALNKEQVRSISTLKNLLNKENKQVDEGIPFIMRLFLVLLLIISLILISYFVYLFWRKYS